MVLSPSSLSRNENFLLLLSKFMHTQPCLTIDQSSLHEFFVLKNITHLRFKNDLLSNSSWSYFELKKSLQTWNLKSRQLMLTIAETYDTGLKTIFMQKLEFQRMGKWKPSIRFHIHSNYKIDASKQQVFFEVFWRKSESKMLYPSNWYNQDIHLFVHLFIRSFIYSFIHPSTNQSIHLSIHLSIYQSIYSFIYSFTHSFVHSFIHSFIHLSTH